jgi:hypothetical protein
MKKPDITYGTLLAFKASENINEHYRGMFIYFFVNEFYFEYVAKFEPKEGDSENDILLKKVSITYFFSIFRQR